MISKKNIDTIQSLKLAKFVNTFMQYFIFTLCLIVSYQLDFKFSDKTELVNDKLIDVSSIFFGIFLGCLFLFERFKNNETYDDFLKFCRLLLFLNIIIIALSFIIILANDKIPITESYIIGQMEFSIKFQTLLFSFYISLFAVTIYNLWKFIKIILIILKSK